MKMSSIHTGYNNVDGYFFDALFINKYYLISLIYFSRKHYIPKKKLALNKRGKKFSSCTIHLDVGGRQSFVIWFAPVLIG